MPSVEVDKITTNICYDLSTQDSVEAHLPTLPPTHLLTLSLLPTAPPTHPPNYHTSRAKGTLPPNPMDAHGAPRRASHRVHPFLVSHEFPRSQCSDWLPTHRPSSCRQHTIHPQFELTTTENVPGMSERRYQVLSPPARVRLLQLV